MNQILVGFLRAEESEEMGISTVFPSIRPTFLRLARLTTKRAVLVSPTLTTSGVRTLLRALPRTRLDVVVCSRFDEGAFVHGRSDFEAIEVLAEWSDDWRLRFFNHPKLNANIFLFDGSCLISSADLTQAGLTERLDYGFVFRDDTLVAQVAADVQRMLDSAFQMEFSEIKEIAGARTRFSRFDLNSISDERAESAPKIKGDENVPPADIERLESYEEERVRLFEKRLDDQLRKNSETTPFSAINYLSFLKSANCLPGDAIRAYPEKATRAAMRDEEILRDYLGKIVAFNSAGEEVLDCLVPVVAGNSVWRMFDRSAAYDISAKARGMFHRSGLAVFSLYFFHRLFSGNYRWMEDLSFFENLRQLVVAELPVGEYLGKLGLRWRLDEGDLPKDWEYRQFFEVVGIIGFDHPGVAWRILDSLVAMDEIVETTWFHSFDYRTKLQEWAQERINTLPVYEVVESSGEDHEKIWTVEVRLSGRQATGTAHSKREAATTAARNWILAAGASGLLTEHIMVQGRSSAPNVGPYVLEGEGYLKRLRDARRVFSIDAPDPMLDCALTPQCEATDSKRRTNGKLNIVGSELAQYFRTVAACRRILDGDASWARSRLSLENFVSNLFDQTAGVEEFFSKHYGSSTKTEKQRVVQSLLAVKWIHGGWGGCQPFQDACVPGDEWCVEIAEPTQALQERLQSNGFDAPKYEFQKSGDDHRSQWKARLRLPDGFLVEGEAGDSKKSARKLAAQAALRVLDDHLPCQA